MSKDSKGLLKYLGLIFISLLLTFKLPRDSYSVIQYLIKPIRFENSVLYLSGLGPLILLIVGIKGLFKLRWFENRSRLLAILMVFVVIMPIMIKSLNIAKSICFSQYEGVQAIDLKDADIQITGLKGNEATFKVRLGLIDYGSGNRDVEVRMYLPESMKSLINGNFIDFKDTYNTYGHGREINIVKEINVQLAEGANIEDIIDAHWDWETVYFDLYNDDSSSKLIYHGV
ncbi:hypothetical protein Desor_2172 [Desulfosporosinus orientis DSM 765]|uniref:Uncharacterized protein n=1 Tax=Desulfosporosinus orientis (strain ATCC 19365 / DSM 765 / NCIMB 8382 / VKM B-1628 / Singapore I) TaxID=768706 RepID=G7W8R6_DESOD|nr:hypothetical protein [Desulfosporosinus orientis]AET67776.1 hypothetical protein Desor_2172 [Desulfosporosinus orientis DSM 765]